ncbi:MAG TPA: hydroxyisourate hydrolase [Rhabdaerophilum sp.]|nr:hydroxyisourate hydrolase [Rhabdaerophilum sp.]
MKAGGISIHAVDVAEGRVAAGLGVVLRRLAPEAALIGEGKIGANGVFDHPSVQGEGITAGTYEVTFAIGDFLRAGGREAAFLDLVPFRFEVRQPGEHYHLPFKFTPYGFSLFRGA